MVGGQRAFIHLEDLLGAQVRSRHNHHVTETGRIACITARSLPSFQANHPTWFYWAGRSGGVGAIIGGTMGLFTPLLFPTVGYVLMILLHGSCCDPTR